MNKNGIIKIIAEGVCLLFSVVMIIIIAIILTIFVILIPAVWLVSKLFNDPGILDRYLHRCIFANILDEQDVIGGE